MLFLLLLLLVVVSAARDDEQAAYESAVLTKEQIVASFRNEQDDDSCNPPKQDICERFDICDPLYTSQWHLNRSFLCPDDDTGVDLQVEWAWTNGYTGKGVLISFIDDGVKISHPDLKGANLNVSIDLNNGGHDFSTYARHGTKCAGVAVARKNNVCGVGVAHEASYGAVRWSEPYFNSIFVAFALNYGLSQVDIYSNSWGPSDYNQGAYPLSKIVSEALERGVFTGRNGKGSIYVWASGNGALYGDTCSLDGYNQSPFTISIGAANQYGRRSDFSESCPALLGVALSGNDDQNSSKITTTSALSPACTSTFSGTSASCPMASGIIALCLEANANLTWRDVQGVLISSSVRIDRNNSQWKKNGAGLFFNPEYGFGLLNASRAVQLALTWETRSKYTFWSSAMKFENAKIPKGGEGFVYDFTAENDAFTNISPVVEHAVLTVDILHPNRSNLTINLISPSGTVSALFSSLWQSATPTLIVHRSEDHFIVGSEIGFGSLSDKMVSGTLGFHTGCTVPSNDTLKNLTVLTRMNQSQCTPYEQSINIQKAGAKSIIFTPDYDGSFRKFEASGDEVLIPVMQVTEQEGSFLHQNSDAFKGLLSKVGIYVRPNFTNFSFFSIQFWGESGDGNWKVNVKDIGKDADQGTVNSLKLSLYGRNFSKEYIYEEKEAPSLPYLFFFFSLGEKSSTQIFFFVIIAVLALAAIITVSYYSYKQIHGESFKKIPDKMAYEDAKL